MIDILQGTKNCGGKEIYKDIIRVFCEDGRKRVKNLQKGFEQRDVGQLALETHSLKSVAATLGANELAVMARKINQDCRNCSEGITSVQWQELIRLYQNVIEEFERNILEEDTEDAVL